MANPSRGARTRTLSMVLAGGEGKRLLPLTLDRAKPAVPFGGQYRLIDFALSNLVNAGYLRIVVLTQYKSHSLDVHLSRTWRMSTMLGNYVTSVPAQMRRGPRWFLGSADAMFQNLNLIADEQPDHVFVFGADHIYRIDPRQMLDHHLDTGAGVTVAAIRMPRDQASQFGVIEVGSDSRILSFREKPANPVGLPDSPDECLVSMGNYVFDATTLVDVLHDDADSDTRHDIGGDLIPRLVDAGVAHVYDFTTNVVPGETERDRHYWRDVGTLDSYFEAQMDLVAPYPVFNLYNDRWPIYTAASINPPAKVVVDGVHGSAQIENSMLSNGVIVSGGSVRSSVLSAEVRLEAGATVDECVLLDRVHVGAGATLRRCIVDKNVVIPPGTILDGSTAGDHGVTVSPGGVVAVAKNHHFGPNG